MTNQKLTLKELKQVVGGSGTDTGVKPKALQLIIPEPVTTASFAKEEDKQQP